MKKVNKSYKIIIDTNIWISFLIGKSLGRLHYYIDNETVSIVTCNEQIQELIEVFKKPKIQKFFSKTQIVEFLDLFAESTEVIILRTKIDLCRDPKDNFLVSLAIDADADYLITGDLDLLVLKKVKNTEIMNFVEFEHLINN